MRDFEKKAEREIHDLVNSVANELDFSVSLDLINFTELNIQPCKACKFCPVLNETEDLYKCLIRDDDFAKVFDRLVATDAIVLCADYAAEGLDKARDVYQKVLERTRCIRRDNFLLTNKPTTSFSIEELPKTSLFSLKVMTSFLRHNTVLCPSVRRFLFKHETVYEPSREFLLFLNTAMQVKNVSKNSLYLEKAEYIPIGYRQTR